jgi:coproporphyrinogen III oxidase-like Fe-S oxidoreductase
MERIDERAAGLLATAGVESVEAGPQSVGAAALAVCHRHFDAERFEAGIEALRSRGITTECDLIVGLPGDRAEDFLAGLDFCLSLDPGKVQASTLHVLPGTDLWQRADELGLIFDPEPPHEIIATSDMGYHDLRRAEARGVYVQRLYASTL